MTSGQNGAMYADGGAGVKLNCRSGGRKSGPAVVFVHGWSSSQDIWARQFQSSLADDYHLVSFDIRGHGYSERPIGDAHYTDARLFADDIAGVIAAYGLTKPVLVGWSSGSLMVADYLREYGSESVAGIALISALYGLGIEMPDDMFGAGPARYMPDTMSDAFPTQYDAMRECTRDMMVSPDEYDIEAMIVQTMMTPPSVRASMMSRVCDNRDVLQRFDNPALIVHGEDDPFIRPPMAVAVDKTLPNSRLCLYANVAHMPFIEAADQFNEDFDLFLKTTVA